MPLPVPRPSLASIRVYDTSPIAATCGCCGAFGRLGVVDLDGHFPLCQTCLPASIQAAKALRLAGLTPPDSALITRNL